MGGWIKLYRDIIENPLWSAKPFSKGQAWIDILLRANHSDNQVLVGNNLEKVKRGTFITSELKLMERWGWSKNKVRLFLKYLESENMIEKKSNQKRTAITVVNYRVYQDLQTTNGPPMDRQWTAKEPQKNHEWTADEPPMDCQWTANGLPMVHEQEEKKYKEKKEENTYSAVDNKKQLASEIFEAVWKMYPCKKGKGKVSDTQKQKLLKIGEDELMRCVERYKSDLKRDASWRKPQNGSTFFNSGYVDYLDANYTGGGANGYITGSGSPHTGESHKPYHDDYLTGIESNFNGF